MVVCKYFMEGYCKFGDRCKYDHIDPYRGYDSSRNSQYSSDGRPQGTSILKAATSSFGRQEFSPPPQHGFVQPQQQHHGFSQNSFGQSPHQFSQSTHVFNPPQQATLAQKPSGLKYNIQELMQIVVRDIAQLEKGGQWQLSSYSPLRELPNMPGLDDYSPEELRWECYKALQNGALPLYQAIVQQLYGNISKINNELKRKDTGYSIVDRWLRDSEQRSATQHSSAFGGSSVATNAFSPFFASEPQPQQPQSHPQTAGSFSFSLSPQQSPGNPNPFQSNSSVFPNNQTSAFPLSNQSSAFAPTNQTSAFPPSTQTSAFAPTNQTSPFAPTSQTPAFSPNSQSSAFSQSTSSFSPLRGQAVDSQVYSSTEVLTEAELKAFQADRFVLGSIPTKPPPRALCNL